MYGLKQSAHMSNMKFAKHLISKGFVNPVMILIFSDFLGARVSRL